MKDAYFVCWHLRLDVYDVLHLDRINDRPTFHLNQPPDTGQMTATSSPPRRVTCVASSTISASTAHWLFSNTDPSDVFG